MNVNYCSKHAAEKLWSSSTFSIKIKKNVQSMCKMHLNMHLNNTPQVFLKGRQIGEESYLFSCERLKLLKH